MRHRQSGLKQLIGLLRVVLHSFKAASSPRTGAGSDCNLGRAGSRVGSSWGRIDPSEVSREVSTSFENQALSGRLAGTRASGAAVERSHLFTSDPSCENVRGQAQGAGVHWLERSAWGEESGGEVSGSHATPVHGDLCGQQRIRVSCEQPPRPDAALPGVQSLKP